MKKAPLYNDLAEGPDGGSAWWLTTDDGVRIRAGYWPGGEKGTVLFFPGRTEYVEKYGRTAARLSDRGYGTVAVDWRGQGLADRLGPDPMLGDVGQARDYQLDVAAVVAMAHAQHLPEPWFLIGHSMGGAIGLRALHDGLPVNAAAFSAPMWGIGMAPHMRPVAWALSWLGWKLGFGQTRVPGTSSESYVLSTPFADNSLTTDTEEFELMQKQVRERPEFGLGGPSLRWLNSSLRETRALRALPPPDVPVVTFIGSLEDIIHRPCVHQVMEKWDQGKLHLVDGAKHEFPMEQPHMRDQFLDLVTALFDANPAHS